MTILASLDRLLLAIVRGRLAHFRRPGDRADRLGDRLIALLSREIARRNTELAGWDAEIRRHEQTAADRELRAAAEREYTSFESGDGLRLQ